MADDSGEIVREAAEAVGLVNVKSLGDAPAWFQNQAYAESLANTQANNSVRLALTAKAGESILSMQPSEAAGESVIAGMLGKFLQMSPPPTNLPTQGQ